MLLPGKSHSRDSSTNPGTRSSLDVGCCVRLAKQRQQVSVAGPSPIAGNVGCKTVVRSTLVTVSLAPSEVARSPPEGWGRDAAKSPRGVVGGGGVVVVVSW